MDIDSYLNEHENKSLLRILTCGSVDDGKSTLIGRLLYDSKLIFDDQLSALRRDSEKSGTTGAGEFDYALLLDGLKAEREQGITIDVAYRYFTTPKRKFIIADCPGHVQYTRNMATGASTADLAIILIDARHGLLTQTRRHAFIVSLLGIRHLIVAVNKMDLFDYDRNVFDNIRRSFEEFATGLHIPDIRYIPLSALKGENIVQPSEAIPWYEGPSLLDILETVDTTADRNLDDFRFPVQYVIRPDLHFRGFAGSVVSGTIRTGDEIAVLPSLRTSRIKRIVTADGDLGEAFAPQAVTLELEDEIDISSGDMIVKADNLPTVSRHLEAIVIWMTDTPLREGNNYLLRHAGRNVKAHITDIVHQIDVNTLEQQAADDIPLNGVARIRLETVAPLYLDNYRDNRSTGVFILIDPVTNTTAGGAMILRPIEENDGSGTASAPAALTPISLEQGYITATQRIRRQGYAGRAILLSGTDAEQSRHWAKTLEQELFARGLQTYYLAETQPETSVPSPDGVQRLAELAYTLAGAGIIAIAAIPHFPAEDFAYWPPADGTRQPLLVWLGEPGTAPAGTHITLHPGKQTEQRFNLLVALLAETNIAPETSTH